MDEVTEAQRSEQPTRGHTAGPGRPFFPFPGLALLLSHPASSLLADSSTLLPPRSPGALGATSLPAPQAPLLLLLLLLLLPVALLLLAAAWCLHWRRKRQRMPYPGERVSQWGGQRAWPESADPLGAIGALPGALTPHQAEDPGLGVGVGGLCGGGP